MKNTHVAKHTPLEPSAVRLNLREPRENNLQKPFSMKRILWGILYIFVIGIIGGCSFGKVEQSEVNQLKQSEVIQADMEKSEIDGQWVGEVDGMDGKPLELAYRFKAEGKTLIGLIESRLGGGQISNGKIDGNDIDFSLNTGEFIILNKGTVYGDEIHITQTVGEEMMKYVLKRVKR